MKKMIQDAIDIPTPLKKDEFIRSYRKRAGRCRTDSLEMLLAQAGYIHKSVWLVSAAVFLAGVFHLQTNRYLQITIISALMPFVSGLAVMESFRSRTYHMDEIEGATLFSLRGIIFARFAVIEASHLLLFAAMILIVGLYGKNDLWFYYFLHGFGADITQRNALLDYLLTGIILSLPYLANALLCMKAEQVLRGRKYEYVCLCISMALSLAVLLVHSKTKLCSDKYFILMTIAACVLLTLIIIEQRKNILCFPIPGMYEYR